MFRFRFVSLSRSNPKCPPWQISCQYNKLFITFCFNLLSNESIGFENSWIWMLALPEAISDQRTKNYFIVGRFKKCLKWPHNTTGRCCCGVAHLFTPGPDAGLQALHDLLRLVELPPVRQHLHHHPGHVVDSPQGSLLGVVLGQVQRFQHFLHAETLSRPTIWCGQLGLELFSQVVEPAEVRGQAEVLPGHLRPQALPEVELTVRHQSEVLGAGEDVPGQTVELADDGREGRGALDVVLGDPELRGYFFWQNVLVDIPASRWHGELVYSNDLEEEISKARSVRCSVISNYVDNQVSRQSPACTVSLNQMFDSGLITEHRTRHRHALPLNNSRN